MKNYLQQEMNDGMGSNTFTKKGFSKVFGNIEEGSEGLNSEIGGEKVGEEIKLILEKEQIIKEEITEKQLLETWTYNPDYPDANTDC